jgi:hypothetical protein
LNIARRDYSYGLQGLKCYEILITNCYTVVVACIVDSSLIANWLLVLLASIALWLELFVVVKPVCVLCDVTAESMASFRLLLTKCCRVQWRIIKTIYYLFAVLGALLSNNWRSAATVK